MLMRAGQVEIVNTAPGISTGRLYDGRFAIRASGSRFGEPWAVTSCFDCPAEVGERYLQPESMPMGLLDRLRDGLSRTREKIIGGFRSLLRGPISDDLLERLEEQMLADDMGPSTTVRLIDEVREAWHAGKLTQAEQIVPFLKDRIVSLWPESDRHLRFAEDGPTVMLVSGVNGSGKTTSVAKLGKYLTDQGKTVILAACDTYRAAAIEQLTIWSERIGIEIVKHQHGADPGAVVYDACQACLARRADVLLVDTAGRLHTQEHLMRELGKIQRVLERNIPEAPHEVLLVLDSTTGQNAVNQASVFSQHVKTTGIILAKLDGSAKGGFVVGIREKLDIPVKFVGLGESLEDIEVFDPRLFVEALLEE
jgi:fused signal recognition particle receptor